MMQVMMRVPLFMLCMVCGVLAQNATQVSSDDSSIFSYLQANGDFSLMLSAVNAAALDTITKNGSTSLTLFVPTNTAINRLTKDLGISAESLLADKTQLSEILKNHIIEQKVSSSDLENGDELISDAETTLTVKLENNKTGISAIGSTAYITEADVLVGESILHIVDEVLLPFKKPELKTILEVAAEIPELSDFLQAVTTAGVEFPSNVYTVFAPSNAAFEKAEKLLGSDFSTLLQDDYLTYVILTGHIIPDGRFQSNELFNGQQLFSLEGSPINVSITDDGVTLKGIGSNAGIVSSDVYAQNAVTHVIDNLLLPYELDTTTIEESGEVSSTTVESAPTSIMDVISGQGSCGCTCDENAMKDMMRTVMTEVLDKYLQ